MATSTIAQGNSADHVRRENCGRTPLRADHPALFWWFSAYAYSAACWGTLLILVMYQAYVSSGNQPHMAFAGFLPVLGARYASLCLITPPLFWIARMWPISRRHLLRSITGYVLLGFAFLAAFSITRWVIFPIMEDTTFQWLPRTLAVLWHVARDNTTTIVVWFYVPLVALAHAIEFRRAGHQREIESLELRSQLARYKLQLLKAQLQPCFLFQTLDDVRELLWSDSRRAEAMLLQLSSLLRANLQHHDIDLIRLADELHGLKLYLEIQALRLGERLQISLDCAAEANDCMVPHMLLLPLVASRLQDLANAAQQYVSVHVTATARQDEVEVCTAFTTNRDAAPVIGDGALDATRMRLDSLYGPDASMKVELTSPRRLRISVRVPRLTMAVEDENG